MFQRVDFTEAQLANIEKLRAFLQDLPGRNFDHSYWNGWSGASDHAPVVVEDVNVCGTSACIGGWAVIVGELAPYAVVGNEVVFLDRVNFGKVAGEWLGLTDRRSQTALFWPMDAYDLVRNLPMTYFSEIGSREREEIIELQYGGFLHSDTTPQQAAAFLARMAAEGGVDIAWWRDIKKDNGETQSDH
jgi:hypothetical protein